MNIDRNAQRVLVTGATGFLGGALSRRLLRNGFQVTAFGRNILQGKELETLGCRFIAGDLKELSAVKAACRDHSIVFHCGALSSPWGSYASFYEANTLGTRNIAQSCLQQDVKRLIHVSTPSIYVTQHSRVGICEEDELPKKSVNYYAATKLLAEQEVDAAAQRGLEVITLRPQALFGPGDPTIVPRLLRVNSARGMPILGKGDNTIDITYIDNVVDALLLCIDAPRSTLGKKYNITNGEPVQVLPFLQQLFAALHIPFKARFVPVKAAYAAAALTEYWHRVTRSSTEPRLTRYGVLAMSQTRTLSIAAAQRDLGYSPRISVSAGLARYAQWYTQGKSHDYTFAA